jgi:hypothetical protein
MSFIYYQNFNEAHDVYDFNQQKTWKSLVRKPETNPSFVFLGFVQLVVFFLQTFFYEEHSIKIIIDYLVLKRTNYVLYYSLLVPSTTYKYK